MKRACATELQPVRDSIASRYAGKTVVASGAHPEDLEIGKEAGETVVSAAWSMKIHMVGNLSACLDFAATTAAQ